jgi:ribonucleoside-diphosphate reductase alpha chain
MKMDNPTKVLSEYNVFTKYAKWMPELNRRETWEEIINRNRDMHKKKFADNPTLLKEIDNVYDKFVMPKKVLPSMRALQFGGLPIEISPNRMYNCGYLPINSIECFSEIMFLLLGGTGIGFSVQRHHVELLSELKKPNPNKFRRILINDSIEGWADSIKILFESYFGHRTSSPDFDYRDIRPKGARLKTSGGKAPGSAPLRIALVKIETMLLEKSNGSQLTPIECHDIICYIARAVVSGGIRRSALISLFSVDDMEMITAKSGQWATDNPQRSIANNSALILRHRIKKSFFEDLWTRIRINHSGEPGIYFSNDKDWGTNPCCEIALRPYQFCNLTECNVSDVRSQRDLENRVKAATFLGTLQASYTDFHYLREVWKKTTEKEALLGVSMTGIASNKVTFLDIEQAAMVAIAENERVSEMIGINSAARVTCVKPSGTASCVLGTSSGIHAWFNKHYIRRVRINKIESVYSYLKEECPELIEDDYGNTTDAVFSIPQKAPSGDIITRTETALQMLERVKRFAIRWVVRGHKKGMNTHNVSATIFVKEHEWDAVGQWMWMNRHYYNGLAILPHDGGAYVQAPFEDITKSKYEEMVKLLPKLDFSSIIEKDDNTDFTSEPACAGGLCEV